MRLRSWEYGDPGAYFLTICAARRGAIFGHTCQSTVLLNPIGDVVASHLRALDVVDTWIVMPDHVHAIVVFEEPRRPVGELVGRFKGVTARDTRSLRDASRLWQRGYYDHVIRGEDDLDRAREYIVTNPIRAALRAASHS